MRRHRILAAGNRLLDTAIGLLERELRTQRVLTALKGLRQLSE